MNRTVAITAVLLSPMVLRAQFTAAVSGTTSTQALLVYRAPSSGPCLVEVSESPTYSPLVHDVNPVLFAGANIDNRPGNLSDEINNRFFVIGKRTTETASDGRLYSRALQAFTRHFFRVQCGVQTAIGEFTTQNPPMGETATEAPPWNAQGFGNYGWPSIDWTDQSKVYIDPQTGFALKRLGSPGWTSISRSDRLFAWQLQGSAWNQPQDILSRSSVASYSGAAGEAIVVIPDVANWIEPSTKAPASWHPGWSFDDLRLRIYGSGSDGSADNRAVEACLSFFDSGLTCDTPYQNIVLPSSDNTVFFPANYPKPFFAGWGGRTRKLEFAAVGGSLTISGNVAVATSGAFNPDWKPGSRIFIENSGCPDQLCTVLSVRSPTEMVLQQSLQLSNVIWKSAASAIRIRKKTSIGTIRLRAGFDFAVSLEGASPGNGSNEICHPEPVTVRKDALGNDAPPRVANLCLFGTATNSTPRHYLTVFFPDNGEIRLLSVFAKPTTWDPRYFESLPASDRPGNTVLTVYGGFVSGSPNCLFAMTDGSTNMFWRLCYEGDYRSYSPGYAVDQDPGYAVNDQVRWTNLTKPSENRSPQQQVAAANPFWNAVEFPSVHLEGASGGFLLAASKVFTGTQQDTVALVHSFEGTTGRLRWTGSTFGSYPNRWNTFHGLSPISSGYAWLLGNAPCRLGSYGNCSWQYLSGPWESTPMAVWKNGGWSADTSINATQPMDACPADIPQQFGATGARCMLIRTRMPCNFQPHPAGEASRHPCPWDPTKSALQDVQPGDQLAIFQNGVGSPLGEQMLVVKISPAGGDLHDMWLMRGAVPTCTGNRAAAVASGWKFMMVPNGSCDGDSIAHAIELGGTGTWMTEDWRLWGGHTTVGYGSGGNRTTLTGGVPGSVYGVRYNSPISSQVGRVFDFTLGASAPFDGTSRIGLAVQSYPSLMQSKGDTRWMLDVNHLNPSSGVGAEIPSVVGDMPFSVLASGTSQVYRSRAISNGGLDLKRFYPVAWAGPYLLRDMSGPGSQITDADVWRYCIARVAGECRPASNTGDVFWNVPQSERSANCVTNTFAFRRPCVAAIHARTNAINQIGVSTEDSQGARARKVTMGLNGLGRQFHFSNAIADSTGQWAFFLCYNCDGMRTEWFAAKLPPWPSASTKDLQRNTFHKLTVRVPARKGSSQARVRFGYAENGPVERHHCTPRQESCVSGAVPFAWESESPSWQVCGRGCDVPISAIYNRAVYYRIEYRNDSGQIEAGPLQVMIVP